MLYRLKLISTGHHFPDVATHVECESAHQAVFAATQFQRRQNARTGLTFPIYDRWEIAQVIIEQELLDIATGDATTPQAG